MFWALVLTHFNNKKCETSLLVDQINWTTHLNTMPFGLLLASIVTSFLTSLVSAFEHLCALSRKLSPPYLFYESASLTNTAAIASLFFSIKIDFKL
jgi:hypothetical protein